MGGLALSVVALERFNLEMIVEIRRHFHDLDYPFL